MNFKDYKTNARYAEQINAGYSARLNGKSDAKRYLFNTDVNEGRAYQHGWDMADGHEQTNRREVTDD